MKWAVTTSKRVNKKLERLPRLVRLQLSILLKEIEAFGPVRGNWPNYGSFGKDRHHCHIRKGHPTYVAVWEVTDKKINLVEVKYAGTHEQAPY